MNSKHKRMISVMSFLVVSFFNGIILGQEDRWNQHVLIDGGSIQLPSNFSAIQTTFSTEKTESDEFTQYSQCLINAKGVHNEIVCSLKISRTWKQNKDGEVIVEGSSKELLEKYSSKMIENFTSFKEYRLHSSKSYQKYNNYEFIRFSLLLNNDESKMDLFALYENGILYYGSTVYTRSEEVYWKSVTDLILSKWKLGSSIDVTAATTDNLIQLSDEWAKYQLDGGSIIYLPANWLCIYKNSKMEHEGSYGFQKLMNLRPNSYEGDISTVNIMRFTDTTENAFSLEDVQECEGALVESLTEGFNELPVTPVLLAGPSKVRFSNKTCIHRKYSMKTSLYEMICEVYTFAVNENIYLYMTIYKSSNSLLWDKLNKQVFTKWVFPSDDISAEIFKQNTYTNDIEEASYIYKSSQNHYSLTLPSDWEKIPEEKLQWYLEMINTATGTSSEFNVAFQKKADEYFTYPYIMIKEIDLGGCPPSEFQKLMLSEEGGKVIEKGMEEVKGNIEDISKLGPLQKFILDDKKHMITSNMLSNVEGVGIVKGKFVGFIGKDAVVWLYCYSLLEDYDFYDRKYFTAVIDSFSYDFAYRYEDYEVLKKKDDPLGLFGEPTKVEGGTPDDPLNIRTTNDMDRSYNTFRKTDNLVASKPGEDYTGIILIGILLVLSVFGIIFIAKRAAKKAKLAVPTITQSAGSEELCDENTDNRELGIKNTSTRDISPQYLGQIVVCANCERNIGKIEASFEFNGNVVCVQCHKKLLEQA